jgi:tRNA G18 (ribose-2'-O)-methylase SpoU
MKQKIRLIYDCLRAPYDFANILQVVLATNACELHITGQSLRHDHPKVLGKVSSWSAKIGKVGLPKMPIYYYDSLEECAEAMHAKGVCLIGTSPQAVKSFFGLDFRKNDFAIVFGTEVGGLSRLKKGLMNEMVQIPMGDQLDFMTLSVITPVVVYEILRRRKINKF